MESHRMLVVFGVKVGARSFEDFPWLCLCSSLPSTHGELYSHL